MGSLGFILVLTLVAIADTNIAIQARNVKLEETHQLVQQNPSQYYQMLPRGPVPPSGPYHDPPGYPPNLYNQMLPRGPVPPSGPSPGPPPSRQASLISYHTLPKGDRSSKIHL